MSEKINVSEFWSVETLKNFAASTKDVEVEGKLVRIKRLSSKTMTQKEQDIDMVGTMLEAVVEPKLTADILKELPASFTKKLFEVISEFSGVSAEKAEKN